MPNIRLKAIARSLRRSDFAGREDGNVAIEAVIIIPMIFWTFLALFSIFDTYRMYSVNQMAAYTLGDAISRETAPIDGAYLNGMLELFEYLARSDDQSSIRVTQVRFDEGDARFYQDWSQKRGSIAALTDADVSGWTDKLPKVPNQERIIMVETWSTYEPPFKTGLGTQEITNLVFTSPRYAPGVCWVAC